MSSFEQFARQMRADHLILHGLYTDLSRQFEAGASEISNLRAAVDRLEAAANDTKQTIDRLAAAANDTKQTIDRLAAAANDTKQTIDRLAAAANDTQQTMRKVIGHSRLSGERTDTILTAMHNEFVAELADLRRRIEILEQKAS